MSPHKERILIIKLGALGDFVQAMGPMAAIRSHHPNAEIILLTTKPYVCLGEACPYVDRVWADSRPKALQVGRWLELRAKLRGGNFSRVYDLQTSDRSGFYAKLLGRGVEWSGIAKGCSHPHANPKRDFMHTIERQAEQLRDAGIGKTPMPDLSWAEADLSRFALPGRFALLVPGGAPHRPAKRWPPESFGDLANRLLDAEILPVVLGAGAEAEIAGEIAAVCPGVRSLVGETDFLEIAALARGAVLAVGNDTGPMHMITLSGCSSVVLYSHESDPALCAQRGPKVSILRKPSLTEVTVDKVWDAVAPSIP